MNYPTMDMRKYRAMIIGFGKTLEKLGLGSEVDTVHLLNELYDELSYGPERKKAKKKTG